MSNVLTCVYCGHQYPEGTPPHGSQILTDHIKVCEKHPLREAEQKIEILRKALIGLVGTGNKKELEEMDLFVRMSATPEPDKTASINAIHAIISTSDTLVTLPRMGATLRKHG